MPDDKKVNLDDLLNQYGGDEGSSMFSAPPKEGDAAKINALISRAMRLLSQRDHGEMELRKKLLTPPVAFSKPSYSKPAKPKAQKSSLSFSKEWQEEEVQQKAARAYRQKRFPPSTCSRSLTTATNITGWMTPNLLTATSQAAAARAMARSVSAKNSSKKGLIKS
ncbi:hypothetical protein ACVWVS_002262 [Ewingella americana]